ncbi:MAG: hypothetical protein ABI622_09510 [Chloroflexota bacterium]
MRTKISLAVASAALAIGMLAGPASAATPDTDCMRAGMNALRSLGVLDDVARDGLPIATAVALGVAPRSGTDVTALPEVLPLRVVLADHRAGSNSLFIYPWCS